MVASLLRRWEKGPSPEAGEAVLLFHCPTQDQWPEKKKRERGEFESPINYQVFSWAGGGVLAAKNVEILFKEEGGGVWGEKKGLLVPLTACLAAQH